MHDNHDWQQLVRLCDSAFGTVEHLYNSVALSAHMALLRHLLQVVALQLRL